MSFFEKKYVVTDHLGSTHKLTAKELCDRVLEDSSKSDYNWIAPARELVRICTNSDFPVEYALTIKIAILNCFANIEHKVNCGSDRYITDPADQESVQYCYNSLYGINKEDAILARNRFLTEVIHAISYIRIFDPLHHPGPTFIKLCEDWNNSKFEEYISKKNINFKELAESLRVNLADVIKTAELNGDFAEDEKKDKESWNNFFKRLNDIL